MRSVKTVPCRTQEWDFYYNPYSMIETDPIKPQHCSNQAHVNDNDISMQTIDTETIDPQSNNKVFITRDIIPLVSETKDESIVETNGSNIKMVHNP